jgi:RecA-family ATPase
MNALDLMEHEFEPIAFAVDKILPAGLTICAGSPKAGKSWAMLDICLAVANGGPALSHLETTKGSALYLAREDTYRRLQSRTALIMGGEMNAPKGLEFVPQEQEWVGGMEGLAHLTEWAEEVGDPRLVVLDTLAKVEPEMGEDGRRGAYTGNYTMMARYKQWADDHNCAVVMVHHDRKQQGKDDGGGMDQDPFSKISGTRGLTGAADTLWFLESKRGTREGALHITGRDVIEQSLELHKVGPLWMARSLPE